MENWYLKRNVNIILDTFSIFNITPIITFEREWDEFTVQFREIPDSTYGDAQDYLALSVYDKDLNIIATAVVIAKLLYRIIFWAVASYYQLTKSLIKWRRF
ncbi:MAG: hypothetical protein IPL21_11350 [Saprospirales bacterium]|nr:hypothetical protein [Saprospirales bacterium]